MYAVAENLDWKVISSGSSRLWLISTHWRIGRRRNRFQCTGTFFGCMKGREYIRKWINIARLCEGGNEINLSLAFAINLLVVQRSPPVCIASCSTSIAQCASTGRWKRLPTWSTYLVFGFEVQKFVYPHIYIDQSRLYEWNVHFFYSKFSLIQDYNNKVKDGNEDKNLLNTRNNSKTKWERRWLTCVLGRINAQRFYKPSPRKITPLGKQYSVQKRITTFECKVEHCLHNRI